MLPASGAWVPNTVMPSGLRPTASANSPWSTIDSPRPPNSTGWFGAHKPHLLDLLLGGRDAGGERFGGTEQHLAFEWNHLTIHELANHRQHGRHLLGHLEIHDHLRCGHARKPRGAATRADRP